MSDVRLQHAPRAFVDHIFVMPTWHKLVLSLAIVLGIGGAAGKVAGYFDHKTDSPAVSRTSAPPDSAGFVAASTDDSRNGAEDSKTTPKFWERVSPHAMKLGVSIVAGFIVGWLFRMFVKTMALIAILGVAAFAALSYFGVMNVDMTQAQHAFNSATEWITTQGTKLFAVVKAHLPSTGGGGLGAFLGFRRRIIP